MTAKYERLANAIREKIRSGELKPGDKLPSISQIREEFQISYGSVRGAMLVLKAEVGGLRANYLLSSQRAPNPFDVGVLRGFRLPGSL